AVALWGRHYWPGQVRRGSSANLAGASADERRRRIEVYRGQSPDRPLGKVVNAQNPARAPLPLYSKGDLLCGGVGRVIRMAFEFRDVEELAKKCPLSGKNVDVPRRQHRARRK